MVGLTNYAAQSYVDNSTGKAAAFANAARYLALFTATGTDANTGFTEVSGTSYARVQIPTASWGSATGTSPSNGDLSPLIFDVGNFAVITTDGRLAAITKDSRLAVMPADSRYAVLRGS